LWRFAGKENESRHSAEDEGEEGEKKRTRRIVQREEEITQGINLVVYLRYRFIISVAYWNADWTHAIL